MKLLPDFQRPEFLREQALNALAFYDPRALDPSGGLFQHFLDDGSVYDAQTRHLVSSTRYVVTFASMARTFPDHPRARAWLDTAAHALDFVQRVHHDAASGGYIWLLRWDGHAREVLDPTQHCYGLAFVLLAQSHALLAGLEQAREPLQRTLTLMEQHFWVPAQGLYADDADRHWRLSSYRGQNANMHACEAMLAAWEATGDARCLERASALADGVTRGLARHAHGLIWEHYDARWDPDWDYNRGVHDNLFRPWGFQPGHHAEWAKLLLTLERQTPQLLQGEPDNWMVHRARELFAAAVQHGWDRHHGGLAYAFAPQGRPDQDRHQRICDGDKYHWVQAEALAAAAMLAERTHDGGYLDWYDRIWQHVWSHFVDHQHGAWYRILGPDNRKLSDQKSPAGKVDYHNIGACLEALAAFNR